MLETQKEDFTQIKGELIQILEVAKAEIQKLDEIFAPGIKVIDASSGYTSNQLLLFKGQDYQVTIDRRIK